MAPTLQFGLDVGVYGRLATRDNILRLARLAETAGFDSLWLADHVIFPSVVESAYPYSPTGQFPVALSEPLLEPMATMGVLVGATYRVKIGTAVLVMPYRNPVVLGKMLLTLDVLSGGRTVLGAGSGWLAEEFTALNTPPFAARGRVTDEYIEIVKRVCQGGQIEFHGEHYQLDAVLSYPEAVQRPHPPILIGGTSAAALRRVVRLGNGWLSVALRPARLAERLDVLRRLCESQGRRFDQLRLCHKLFLNIGEAKPGVDGDREPGTGTHAEILDDIRRIADLGFDSIIVRYLGTDPEAQRTQIQTFASDIVPKV